MWAELRNVWTMHQALDTQFSLQNGGCKFFCVLQNFCVLRKSCPTKQNCHQLRPKMAYFHNAALPWPDLHARFETFFTEEDVVGRKAQCRFPRDMPPTTTRPQQSHKAAMQGRATISLLSHLLSTPQRKPKQTPTPRGQFNGWERAPEGVLCKQHVYN